MAGAKYFIKQYSFNRYRHGGAGYADIEEILLRDGYRPIALPFFDRFDLVAAERAVS